MKQRIGVIGLGNWGTALANLIAHNGHTPVCWDIDKSVTSEIATKRHHPYFHTDVLLHEAIQTTDDKLEPLSLSTVLLVVPASVLGEVLKDVELDESQTIISAIKGLEPSTLHTPLQYVHKISPHLTRLAVVSGPSFAVDVIHGRPAGVVAASNDPVVARSVASLLDGDSMRIYLSTDTVGVELGGVLKNVIALSAGVVDGLNLGESAKAAMITRGLAEMTRLAVAMGAEERTLSGLSGMGDLIMTATCDTSRNRQVGLRLGKGEKLEDILSSLGSTAEAVKSAPLVLQLAYEHQIEMPITQAAVTLISGALTAKEMINQFTQRPIKSEF